jgi:hypothetical protein
MNSRRLAIGLSALAALAFVAGTAKAGDTVRLSLPGGDSAPTHNLGATPADLAADTVATRFFRGGFIGHRGFGGFRGYYGGYRGFGYGGYRGFGYGGYRGFGYGGYRGFGYGGYRGFGYGGYYGPRFYGSYYYGPTYYSYPSYSYPYYSGYYPISATGAAVATQATVIRPAAPANYERPLPMPYADDQPAPGQPGTYPYDGGPQRQVPMPSADESPVRYPNRDKPAIVEDIVVKLPAKSGKWNYPAYGEKPSR